MSVIAIDFLMGPDWESGAIAYFGQGPHGYSHCASVLADGRYLDARDDVLAGVPSGIRIRDQASETWVRKRRASKVVSQGVYDDWEGNLKAKIGDAYATRDILGMIFDEMLHKPGTYDCSALAINALQHVALVPFPLIIPAHQVTPDAALIIVQCAGFTIGAEQTQRI
jgi:hypothetical protein